MYPRSFSVRNLLQPSSLLKCESSWVWNNIKKCDGCWSLSLTLAPYFHVCGVPVEELSTSSPKFITWYCIVLYEGRLKENCLVWMRSNRCGWEATNNSVPACPAAMYFSQRPCTLICATSANSFLGAISNPQRRSDPVDIDDVKQPA
ncbi:hypothetical protein J6590_041695 [Homalodisca vitripennis]|nr:hypothetical protein J6590_041695 [Homalodisca vitripennis]